MSYHPLRILVTSVGGDLGQAIVKSLRLMDNFVQVFGCDAASDSIGAAFADEFFTVPFANDKDYISCLSEICKKKKIHAALPGSEPEIHVLSQLGVPPKLPSGAVVVCQDYSWLKIYGDKLECFRALDGKVDLAWYADGRNEDEVKKIVAGNRFPCVVKSRRSCGSKSIRTAYDEKQTLFFLNETPDPVIQEHIDDTYGEFSVGVFSCEDFTTAVTFVRELGPAGNSWSADNLVQDRDVLEYAYTVARASRLRGSCNVQVRRSSQGVRLLEINSRFSSLVAARAVCGFKDLEWSICMALNLKMKKPDNTYRPLKFRRYFHELIDFGEGYIALDEWVPKHASALEE